MSIHTSQIKKAILQQACILPSSNRSRDDEKISTPKILASTKKNANYALAHKEVEFMISRSCKKLTKLNNL